MALGDLVEKADLGSEIYIRKFKEGATKIRILPAEGDKRLITGEIVHVYGTAAWVNEYEHYSPSFEGGYVPCVKAHGQTCGPCLDPDQKVRKRNNTWFINAIDVDGTVRVYRLGVTLFSTWESRESLSPGGTMTQPLSQTDQTVHHIGSGKDSKYDPIPSAPYEIDFSKVTPHDIGAILQGLAAKAASYYTEQQYNQPVIYQQAPPVQALSGPSSVVPVYTESRITPGMSPAHAATIPAIAPDGRIVPGVTQQQSAQPDTPITIKAQADGLKEFQPPTTSPNGGWGKNPSETQIEAAETGVIKAWLDEMEVEYPSRAARARLVDMAKAKAAEPPF